MDKLSAISNKYLPALAGIVILSGLYLTSIYSYILFHSLAELFSIAVAWGVFMLAWNSRRYSDNNYLLFISIAFLFVGGIDLLHTLAYKGIGVFQGYDSNLPTQLWISARYLQSISFLIALFFASRKFRTSVVLTLYIVAVSFLLASIFYWKVFPDCYVEGTGLTPFKKVSEYIISLILLAAIMLLFRNKGMFEREVLRLLVFSLSVSIGSELAFTNYINVYGLSNLLGHYLKIFSFYLIYKAIIATGIVKPFDLVFRDLKQKEEALRESEERYRSYIEVTGQLGWTTNADGEIVEDVPSWRTYTGQTYDEIKGWGWSKAIHPDDLDHTTQVWKKAVTAKSIYEVEYRIRRHDGIYRHFMARGIPVFEEDGRIREWAGTCIDITERKQAEKRIEHLASFPQLNPNPIIEIDSHGKVTFYNPAIAEILNSLGLKEDPNIFFPGDLYNILNALGRGDKEQFFYREIKIKDKVFAENIYVTKKLNVVRIYATDITEINQAKERLLYTLDETRKRQAEVTVLLSASRTVLEQREFNITARSIFDSCKNLVGASAGYIALLSKNGAENEVVFLDPGGLPCSVDPSLPMPIRGLREVAYRTGEVAYENDFSNSKWMEFMPEGHVSLENALFAPLVIQGNPVGLLGLANKPEGFTENDAHIASAFGELAAIALYNSRLLESLKENEERFRSVVETAYDGIISSDSKGNIISWNKGAETIFGFSAEEIIGKSLIFLMPERFREVHNNAVNRMISTGEPNIIDKKVEFVGLRKDGTEFPLELSIANWQERGEIFFAGIVRDITGRKQAEEELWQHRNRLEELVNKRTDELIKINEELEVEISERKLIEEKLKESREQLRNLTAHLQTVREEERKYISREIHDELGQALTALKMEMSWLGHKYRDHEKLFEKIKSMINLIDSTIQAVKRISSELRPSLLDDLGLPEAVEWQTREFQERTGISCELIINPDNIILDKGRSIAIFRIFQEALTNVARHSKAKKAKVCLEKKDGEIILNIEDTGKGIKEKEISDPQSFGLIGIRERVESLGGTINITGIRNKGTKVTVIIPFAEQ